MVACRKLYNIQPKWQVLPIKWAILESNKSYARMLHDPMECGQGAMLKFKMCTCISMCKASK